MTKMTNLISALCFLCISTQGFSQIPAFPGAEGFGAFARGGHGGDVYTVNKLHDSGPGSLREGIESAERPSTIVFTVSGLIRLNPGDPEDRNGDLDGDGYTNLEEYMNGLITNKNRTEL